MNGRSSFAAWTTGLIIGIIGLLNVVLGIMAVVSSAFPSAEGKVLIPTIGVGSIVFGLVMLTAGALWITSAIGFFTVKKWASTLALYIAPAIVAINIAGVLSLWGFVIKIGWATLSAVTAVGSIWYLSRKELASFFLISVAEHVVVIIVFAVLIYSEPADIAAETREKAVIVTIEEIKQQEPILAEIVPPERARLEKPPTLPKIEIRSVTATDPGAVIEGSIPQLPKTHAQVVDTDGDTVLRSPGPKEREQSYEDAVPELGVESVLDSSRKPTLGIGPSERVKEGPRATVARTPGYIRDSVSSRDERLGPSSEVARPSFVGDITGDIAGRKVVFWPTRPEGFSGTEGGSATIKFWVDPAGTVTRVKISKKSGNPGLDKIAAAYVQQIHFEELPQNFQKKVQSGEISINFELIRGSG